MACFEALTETTKPTSFCRVESNENMQNMFSALFPSFQIIFCNYYSTCAGVSTTRNATKQLAKSTLPRLSCPYLSFLFLPSALWHLCAASVPRRVQKIVAFADHVAVSRTWSWDAQLDSPPAPGSSCGAGSARGFFSAPMQAPE